MARWESISPVGKTIQQARNTYQSFQFTEGDQSQHFPIRKTVFVLVPPSLMLSYIEISARHVLGFQSSG